MQFLMIVLASFTAIAVPHSQDSPHGDISYECTLCHDPDEWLPIRTDRGFNHDTTGFIKTGSHHTLDCIFCHKELKFKDTPGDCFRCHADIHNGELGVDCARCHEPTDFTKVEDFTGFHETTRFPLRGPHRTALCVDCHGDVKNGRWRGLNTACVSCHYDDYRSASRMDHAGAGFGTNCIDCHNEIDGFRNTYLKSGGAVVHSWFPLAGAHHKLSCADCHSRGIYEGTPHSCYSCHERDYIRTVNPNHTVMDYQNTCEDCHTPAGWDQTSFDHDTTSFPLTGAHLTADCNACHTIQFGKYPPKVCYDCHKDRYAKAPEHAALQFPSDCSRCHTTRAFAPQTFIHSSFPIYSGAHRGEWTSCSVCHYLPGNFGLFNCLVCHKKREMDSEHSELVGYIYSSTHCYTCHADGKR